NSKRLYNSRKEEQNQLIVKERTGNYECKLTDSGIIQHNYTSVFLKEAKQPRIKISEVNLSPALAGRKFPL
ncbi:hypothetical protein, partial [Geoalkalibacter halelectricus]|uniref:hypothetical protein n=1 Tax=Geoalkalibacter halelectricus TaxID=2847045 RepID=UPI003D1E2394